MTRFAGRVSALTIIPAAVLYPAEHSSLTNIPAAVLYLAEPDNFPAPYDYGAVFIP